ncbi:MAG: gamma-butyrobetaine hydroxylase-like domain-containing protein, partial [Pseudomonas sp.]
MLIPTRIKLNKSSKTLELGYADGQQFALPAEFLRVYSPSAEVQGHGKPILQYGKMHVALTDVQPAGN